MTSRAPSAQSTHSTGSDAANSKSSQGEVLAASLALVRQHSASMRRSLEKGAVMDGFRHAALMLATLRTSLLSPRNYYELYMAVFDALSFLAQRLFDGHVAKEHALADLYELVQYAGNIVPRLYLMLTVGAVQLRVAASEGEQVPVKELLTDMLEMAKGVQHPMRGLFLRYYLSVMTRDHLPNHTEDGPQGTLQTSIHFLLHNFIEINKLWVRLQYIGHSSERDKREVERRELCVIVGSGLVRLSQLDDLGWEDYKNMVLPQILGEIVNCKDPIAQDYLMDIIIQVLLPVFPEEFHFRTLDIFLSASSQLSKATSVKKSIIGLMDRFISYADRMKEEAEEARRVISKTPESNQETPVVSESGIPDEIPLFGLFFEQITTLVTLRNEFVLQDIASLLVPLMNLSLKCYPDRLDFIDQILGFAKSRFETKDPKTTTSILHLLLAPIETYSHNPLLLLTLPSSTKPHPTSTTPPPHSHPHNSLIEPHPTRPTTSTTPVARCGNYTHLLRLLPHTSRRTVANSIARAMVTASTTSDFLISTASGVEAVFGELCSVLVTDCVDGNVCGAVRYTLKPAKGVVEEDSGEDESGVGEVALDWDEIVEEQELVARLVQGVGTREGGPDEDLELMALLRQYLGTGGDVRIRFTLPPFIYRCFRVVQNYLGDSTMSDKTLSHRLLSTYHFTSETITALSTAKPYTPHDSTTTDHYHNAPPLFTSTLPPSPETALHLFLTACTTANTSGHASASHEFLTSALGLYEDAISPRSTTQSHYIHQIIATLSSVTILPVETYEVVVDRVVGYCSRLLRREEQVRAFVAVSRLFWGIEGEDVGARVGLVVEETGVKGGESDATADEMEAMKIREDLFGKSPAPTTAKEDALKECTKGYRNAARVLECLQRALRIAEGVLDPGVKMDLFVWILEQYVVLYQDRVDTITIRHINSLLDLIHQHILQQQQNQHTYQPYQPATLPTSIFSPASSSSTGSEIPDTVTRHFENVVSHLRVLKVEEARALQPEFGVVGFGVTVCGMWGDLNL
ncbi:Vacuolar protein sorting-associated protein 35 [Podochytrium sp. JEL0797]|nr:Vacuolar protein sorting-associated protein 35 [Podochytrium sp. JEL0797]